MRTPEDPCRDPASEARDDHASEPRATPETDAGWHPPFSYDIDEDGAYEVAVLANPKHTQGAWVKIEDYRRLERQRDELMEALELWGLVDDEFTTHGVNPVFASLRNAAIEKHRATIAAVKGGRDV